jgi:hypothetical protein
MVNGDILMVNEDILMVKRGHFDGDIHKKIKKAHHPLMSLYTNRTLKYIVLL